MARGVSALIYAAFQRSTDRTGFGRIDLVGNRVSCERVRVPKPIRLTLPDKQITKPNVSLEAGNLCVAARPRTDGYTQLL
jgi:hypothetical protein